MAISDRISSMHEHVEDIYDTLSLGGDSTQNKNIVNINNEIKREYKDFLANGTDTLWNNWEKVIGEGTTLILNNTLEAKMKIDLKGDTYQYSTTGKNLLPTQVDRWEQGTIDTNTGTLKSSTTRIRTIDYYPISNDTNYYISIQNSNYCFINIMLYDSNKQFIKQYYNIDMSINGAINKQINIPSSEAPNVAYMKAIIKNVDNVSTIVPSEITTIKPQIELGTSKTTWEEYTGNQPSPNPDYPQEVQVVSGDNTVKVEGKNLFDGSLVRGSISSGSSIRLRSENQINVLSNTTYTLNCTSTYTIQAIVYEYDSEDNRTQLTTSFNGLAYTFTTSTTTKKIRFVLRRNNDGELLLTDVSNVQLEQGSSASEYTPYVSQTYPINLPVENLFDKDVATYKDNKIINDNGVETDSSVSGYTTSYINVKPNTIYTIQGKIRRDTSYNSSIYFYDTNKTFIRRTAWGGTNINYFTFTTPNDCYYIQFQYAMEIYDASTVQIEKGSKANHYTEYGTTPIELCKIGTYQDYIIKNTNKNLISNFIQGYYYNENLEYVSNDTIQMTDYIKVQSGKTYTYSYTKLDTTNTAVRVNYFNSNKEIQNQTKSNSTTSGKNSFSRTIPNGIEYIRISNSISYIANDIMLNEGSIALPYEPYGSGKWYLYKATSEVVLNGSETGWSTSNKTYTLNNYINAIRGSGVTVTRGISNNFTWGNGSTSTYVYGSMWFNDGGTNLRFQKDETLDLAGFKTWLSNNNTSVYYILETPTNTEITNTTLLNQLDNLANANSYNEQTNVNQTNNDMPFIIDAIALKNI